MSMQLGESSLFVSHNGCAYAYGAANAQAGHEPVCLVPGSVDKYLHVPDCTLQQSLDSRSEGFLL